MSSPHSPIVDSGSESEAVGSADQIMTPRRKIQALLAACDSAQVESSEEASRAQKRPRTNSSDTDGRRSNDSIIDRDDTRNDTVNFSNDTSATAFKASTTPLRGNGLGMTANEASPDAQNGEECGDSSAYSRVKRMLDLRNAEAKAPKSPCAPTTPSGNASSRVHSQSSSPSSSRSSPGLFVSPYHAHHDDNSDGENDLKHNLLHDESPMVSSHQNDAHDLQPTTKFQQLVARKRAEREVREAAETDKEKQRLSLQANNHEQSSDCSANSSSESDVDRQLTQHVRPTRKAGKKALEEMSRETQRLSRNMQLAHQATTKKKITKESLLARFNFNSGPNQPEALEPDGNPSSSNVCADHERGHTTPPSSPPSRRASETKCIQSPFMTVHDTIRPDVAEKELEELPDLDMLLNEPAHIESPDKNKGQKSKLSAKDLNLKPLRIKNLRIAPENLTTSRDDDIDDDLEIIPVNKSKAASKIAFDRNPKESTKNEGSLRMLRALANLNSPPSQKQLRTTRPVMSLNTMQQDLRRRARLQAIEERNAKVEELKTKGIVVQSTEEKEKDQVEMQDLLEKARNDAVQIKEREKQIAQRAKVANGEKIEDSSDESNDEDDPDYEDLQQNHHQSQEEDADIEISGSEDAESDAEEDGESEVEEDGYMDGDGAAKDDHKENSLQAKEKDLEHGIKSTIGANKHDLKQQDEMSEVEVHHDLDQDNDDIRQSHPQAGYRRRPRQVLVSDDEDEENDNVDRHEQHMQERDVSLTDVTIPSSNPASNIALTPSFGFQNDAPPMGMTQIFQGTMAPSQTQASGVEQDSQILLTGPPEPYIPTHSIVPDTHDAVNQTISQVANSQGMPDFISEDASCQPFLPSHELGVADAQHETNATQMTEIPDPTQDVGFSRSPALSLSMESQHIPASTIDTILLSRHSRSPEGDKKRSRLYRRSDMDKAQPSLGAIPDEQHQIATHESSKDAFAVMTKASRKARRREALNKKHSEAKEMFEEQAEESEDEYAGLGGASDDDSGEGEDEQVNAMMDDGAIDVDEAQMAALHANRERREDEEAVSKLYKDVTTGALRRKRGGATGDFDLSDSDDEAEARRRKRKQREFAKMRKALLENENVGKIAEDPRKSAFLKAIEDHDREDDDFDFLANPAQESFCIQVDNHETSQSQSESQPQLESQLSHDLQADLSTVSAAGGGGNKSTVASSTGNRLPAAQRRTPIVKKPATIAEIRDSLTFLTEDPGSMDIEKEDAASSDEDLEGVDDENALSSSLLIEKCMEEQHAQEAAAAATAAAEAMPPPPRPLTSGSGNPRRVGTKPIVDRILLKRASSSSSSRTSSMSSMSSSSSSLAFHNAAQSGSAQPFFPSLLRRATTSNLSFQPNSANAHGISHHAATERAAGGAEQKDYVKRGGRKGSSISSFGRRVESIKAQAIDRADRRRREEKIRLASARSGPITLARVLTLE